jgi:23S rRNA pseudouridine2605 synthase
MAKERLQKILAAAGVASRRDCEQLIVQGGVCINGRVVECLPAFADPQTDIITVQGKRIRPARKVYYLLNKPKGVVCTNSDPQGRKKAIDFVGGTERIFCVGRLDADSTGVIILTNDTSLVNRLTHPRFEVLKTYVVRVRGQVRADAIEKLRKGIWLAEGRTKPAFVKILKRGCNESLLEIAIHQGLNRQIRRMLARVGHKVISLGRTGIGRLNLAGLGVGRFRQLTAPEITYLQKCGTATAIFGQDI